MLLVTFKYIVFALLMIVCAMLLLLVLMQRPKQEGLGAAFGAQMTDQAFGARTTDVLKKGTIFFGSLFMILCFLLSVLMLNEHHDKNKSTILQNQPKAVLPVAPAAEATTTEAPAAEQPAEAPATEAPAAEQPAEEAPATEAPAAEQPAEEAPATEAPAAEQPAEEAPATEQPAA